MIALISMTRATTHQDTTCRRLTGYEFPGPVLGLRHPADLSVRGLCRIVIVLLLLLRSPSVLLTDQPRQYPPRQHEKQPREERNQTGAEEDIPVTIVQTSLSRRRRIKHRGRHDPLHDGLLFPYQRRSAQTLPARDLRGKPTGNAEILILSLDDA